MNIMTPGGFAMLTASETKLMLSAVRSITDVLITQKDARAPEFVSLHNKLNMDKAAHYRPVFFPLTVRVKKKGVCRGKKRRAGDRARGLHGRAGGRKGARRKQ